MPALRPRPRTSSIAHGFRQGEARRLPVPLLRLPALSEPQDRAAPVTKRDALVLERLSSVKTMARLYYRRTPGHVEYWDLVQDGMIALIKAADNYQPERGYKFWTYAERRCLGAMTDGIRRMNREMGRYGNRRAQIVAVDGIREEIENLHSPEPDPDANYQRRETDARLIRAVKSLGAVRRTVVYLYFWRDCDYEQIAEAIGVSRSGAWRILKAALRQLKTKLAAIG